MNKNKKIDVNITKDDCSSNWRAARCAIAAKK